MIIASCGQKRRHSPHPVHRISSITAKPEIYPTKDAGIAFVGHFSTHIPQPMQLTRINFAILDMVFFLNSSNNLYIIKYLISSIYYFLIYYSKNILTLISFEVRSTCTSKRRVKISRNTQEIDRKMYRRNKKDMAINIDEKMGHLYLGNKDLRLLILRPIDLIEFAEFAGASAEDILIWVGKSIGKHISTKLIPDEEKTEESLSNKKQIILSMLETIERLGYGFLISKFKKDHVLIKVVDPLALNEKENIMAKNICLLYQGIFNGFFESLNIDVDGEEIECCLVDHKHCIFKYTLLVDEFADEDIDLDRDISDSSAPLGPSIHSGNV
jgi:predicted hydrocarbon binding protein